MFDLAGYIRQNNVAYIDRGPNVQRNNINICCPFCGDDPSYHMGISLTTSSWGCWRNSLHRGKRPHRLLRALFGYSWDQIETIVGDAPEGLDHSVDTIEEGLAELELFKPKTDLDVLEMPEEFKPITSQRFGKAFVDYLVRDRGFKESEVPSLVERYDLRYAVSGEWKFRVIFPLTFDGKLVGWTGRSIVDSQFRYKTHPLGSQSKRVLFNYDAAAEGGQLLIPVEGPFDALKLDFYGRKHGAVSVAFMGVAITAPQLNLVAKLSKRFERTGLLLDADADAQSLDTQSKLSAIRAETLVLPIGAKDPGELDERGVLQVIR